METFNDDKGVIPYCICFKHNKNKDNFYGLECIKHFFSYISNIDQKKTIFYIHNINFDGFLIIEYLSDKKIEYSFFINEMNIYYIKIVLNKKEIIFKCSYKIFPRSLKDISKIFKIKDKGVFPYKFVNEKNLFFAGDVPNESFFNTKEEYDLFKKNNNTFDLKEKTIEYCYNDIEVTYLFLKKILESLKIFNINIEKIYSAPSLALKIFEKHFNKNKISLKNNALVEKFSRKSYFGGRCEVYGNPKKDEKIFHFDFSGMYAQCMTQKFPFGSWEIIQNPNNIDKPGIYWIEFESSIHIPILPHHRISDNKLMFTNGNISGAYWFEEINLFLKYGGKVTNILYALVFEKYDYIFDEYVNFFTELRKKNNDINGFAKLMINSIYGRLGLKKKKNYYAILNSENYFKINKKVDIISHKRLNNLYLVEILINKKSEKEFSIKNKVKNNIVIASAITSKARIKLYEAQQSVISKKGRLLYSDTDSIFAAYYENVLGETHGEVFWDPNNNKTLVREALFFAPKSYALKYENNTSEVKIKGYNQKSITFNEIKEKFYKKENLKINNFTFLKKKNIKLSYENIIKEFDLNFYDKRWFEDDFTTKPFLYNNFKYFKE